MKKSILILSLFVSGMAFSQTDPPSGPPDGEIPIDGGIGFLIATGAAIGAKICYKSKYKKSARI